MADFHERLSDGVNCCILLEMMPAGVTMFMTQLAGEDGTLICAQVWVDQPGAGENVSLTEEEAQRAGSKSVWLKDWPHRLRDSEKRLAVPAPHSDHCLC